MIQAAPDADGFDAVLELVCGIIDGFDGRIAELERRLDQNCSNSNKQPFSGGLKDGRFKQLANNGRRRCAF